MTAGVFTKDWWVENATKYETEIFKHGPAYEAQEEAVRQVLGGLHGVRTVLEVGAGFGRITRLIREAFPDAAILPTDVAPMMDGVVYFDLDNGAPRNPDGADLVVAAEVLMHRPPGQIAEDVATLCAMANLYVLTVDWHEDSDRFAEGCYQHDYWTAFRRFGAIQEIEVPEARQAVYLVDLYDKEEPNGQAG